MSEPSGCSMALPSWKCHKEVWADKITNITHEAGVLRLFLADGGSIAADLEYVRKHNPKVGGYYVVYQDGYKSWSPAEAFEDGYTRVAK